jgi:hypothetical protein
MSYEMFDTSLTHTSNRDGAAFGYPTDAADAVTAGREWSA